MGMQRNASRKDDTLHPSTSRTDTDRTHGMDAANDIGAERAELNHFAARKAAKHASAVISALRDALVIVDERGAITDVNGAFCTMTGLGRHQLIGTRKYRFWSRADSAANAAAIADLLHTTEVGAGQVELVLTRKSGDRFRVSASIAGLRDRDGEPIGYAATLREVGHAPCDPAAPTPSQPDQAGLISELALAIAEPSPEMAFARIAARAAHTVNGDAAMIVRIEGGDAARVGRWAAPGIPDIADIVSPRSVSQVFADGGLRADDGPDQPFASVIGLPIRLGGRPWGALYVAASSATGALPGDAIARLSRFVATATLALIAVDARRPFETPPSRDRLTGLDDRHAFDERLHSELGRAARYGRDLSLVVMQIDALDTIAADHGEECADRVIAAIAGILRRLVRVGDIVARIRPDGFSWLLPETDARAAVLAAERAQVLIGAISLPTGGFATLSCGIADARDADHVPDELVRHAELALRQACTSGAGVIARFGASRPQVATVAYGADGRRQTLASLRLVARVMDTTGGQSAQISEIVADLAECTARRMGWNEDDARLLHEATLVRDIGMLGIPETIRSKPHGLSAAERRQLQTHAELGAQLVGQVLTEPQVAWIRHHHERFDGAGFPAGISGTRIPQGARIIAAADAWIELVSELKGRTCTAEILTQFEAEAGWQFCPEVVSALIGVTCGRRASRISTGAVTSLSAPADLLATVGTGIH